MNNSNHNKKSKTKYGILDGFFLNGSATHEAKFEGDQTT